jgi:transposase InsO family protein
VEPSPTRYTVQNPNPLGLYGRLNQKTAIQFVDYALERFPFRVDVIQTDNGSDFQATFHWHVLDTGVGHEYIKPQTPRLNGKVERSHGIDAEEFYRLLDGVVIDDSKVFNEKLREWEHFLQLRSTSRCSGWSDAV